MKRLFFGQLLIIWSFTALADDIRVPLRQVMESFSSESCVEDSKKIASTFTGLKVEDYQNEIRQGEHPTLLKELWDFKIKLHTKMRNFYSKGELSPECTRSMRSAFKAVREVEDFIEESYLRNRTDIKFPNSAFAENNPHLRLSPNFKDFKINQDLQSGDVILSRGNAYTSAAIANLGEFDTQFSHLSIVYKDDLGKIWTVEAHIEVGSFVRKLEDHIKDSNFRTMIFRFDDPLLAKSAATFAFEKVKKATETNGNIPYDFGFDMDNSTTLFCSELISWAFGEVSNNEVLIPMVRNRIQLRKTTFVKDIGITAENSFIPADIEIDPRFSIVAEWRDANRINDSLEKDAILQSMFTWVDNYGYRMKNGSSKKSFFYRNIVWVLRRTPILKTFVTKKLPINMSRRLIGYFGVLESIGELLHEELKKADTEAISKRGFPLLMDEKFKVLDLYRKKDLEKRNPKLHDMFRPEK
jgi:hypothetical protein